VLDTFLPLVCHAFQAALNKAGRIEHRRNDADHDAKQGKGNEIPVRKKLLGAIQSA
jgi:hypothetical protein